MVASIGFIVVVGTLVVVIRIIGFEEAKDVSEFVVTRGAEVVLS